jgi:hypothetical protein
VSARRAELVLLAASVATGLLALEAGFRLAASLAQRRTLERASSEPPPPGGLATLGQMVRPSRPNRALDVVAALGLPLIDAGVAQAEYLRAHGGSDLAASALVLRPDDQHPSGLSHRLAADAIYDWMRARGPVAGPGH